MDYFEKEYSLLDRKLSGLKEIEAECKISSRINFLYNKDHSDKYTKSHMKSYKISKSNKLIYTIIPKRSMIANIESALIKTAKPIVNVMQTNTLYRDIDIRDWRLAKNIVQAWNKECGCDLFQEFEKELDIIIKKIGDVA